MISSARARTVAGTLMSGVLASYSAFNFHHQNRKMPAAKRGSMLNVHCRNPEQRMSRRFRDICGTSALPPLATVELTFWIGSFVPILLQKSPTAAALKVGVALCWPLARIEAAAVTQLN